MDTYSGLCVITWIVKKKLISDYLQVLVSNIKQMEET